MADTGNTATIAFATSGFTAAYTKIGGSELTRPKIKTSHLETASKETYIPGDLVDCGEWEVEFQYDPNEQPPYDGAAEAVTITYPVPAGDDNGATMAGTAFLTKFKTTDLVNNELQMATATLCWDGETGPTFSDSTQDP